MTNRRWLKRADLYTAVVEVIADATTDPKRNGIVGRLALAEEVGCSAATLTAEMPQIVKHSRQMYPGYAVQCASDPGTLGPGRPMYRYRLVDEQAVYEQRGSCQRLAKSRTAATRTVHELGVLKAGPAARAAIALISAGEDMLARGQEMLAESIH